VSACAAITLFQCVSEISLKLDSAVIKFAYVDIIFLCELIDLIACFFFCQGTTRPTHYHILHDEIGFNPDDLQELVHSLSYV